MAHPFGEPVRPISSHPQRKHKVQTRRNATLEQFVQKLVSSPSSTQFPYFGSTRNTPRVRGDSPEPPTRGRFRAGIRGLNDAVNRACSSVMWIQGTRGGAHAKVHTSIGKTALPLLEAILTTDVFAKSFANLSTESGMAMFLRHGHSRQCQEFASHTETLAQPE